MSLQIPTARLCRHRSACPRCSDAQQGGKGQGHIHCTFYSLQLLGC